MKYLLWALALLGALTVPAAAQPAQRMEPAPAPPALTATRGITQLTLDGKPLLLRGGELENSTASDLALMERVWPKLKAAHFNTVLAPVTWELVEPREGRFDWRSLDGIIAGARRHGMHLVLLWFGSWKNSQSSYVPAWVKRDQARFPRAATADGKSIEILSALSDANLRADADAFAALMAHLKQTDGARRTVLMVQVENEVGMIPEARDHSPAAEAAFAAPVPRALTDWLAAHRQGLDPALKTAWESHGAKAGAGWAETFGAGVWTDELFNAWTEGLFTGRVAARGKAVYPLPMFVNAALVRPGRLPGVYPSGGPLPHLFDIWKAAAPAIDFLSPDLYFPNFVEWADKYARPGNAMFIPETGRVSGAQMGANAFYAVGKLAAMGFSPYQPEQLGDADLKALGDAYGVLEELTPLILARQGTARIAGITAPSSFEGAPDLAPQRFTFGDWVFDVRFKQPSPISTGQREDVEIPGAHGGLILQTGPDEFIVAGTGLFITFGSNSAADPIAGIERIEEGHFVDGAWKRDRVLNGDDNNQGRNLCLPAGQFVIRRVRLYRHH